MKVQREGELIPAVSIDLLMKADRKVAADHKAGLEPDVTVSIVSALHDECEPDEMIAISHRLTALANLIVDGDTRRRDTGVARCVVPSHKLFVF